MPPALWIALAVLAALPPCILLCLAILGLLTPRTHQTRTSVEVPASREAVWRVLTTADLARTWYPNITALEHEAGSPREGLGARWTLTFGRNRLQLVVDIWEPLHRVRRTIADDDAARAATSTAATRKAPFTGSWDHILEDAGPGRTRITILEEGTIPNPVVRAIARLRGFGTTLNTTSTALAARQWKEDAKAAG